MIVTTGRAIKIQVGEFRFERDSENPGVVHVYYGREISGVMPLPTNAGDVENFIAAYRRAIAEDVDYRKSEHE